MPDIHIEEFFRDSAVILLQLYYSFPSKTTVFVEDISGPDFPDEFGLHSRRHLACFGAMIWLAEEGYLRFADTIRQEAIDQAILTQRSFMQLSALVSPADKTGHCQADDLRHALQHESSTQLAKRIREALFDHSGTAR